MYLLHILGIVKRSKERIQLTARLYYNSEYSFFVLNAFRENQGPFKFQDPNQTPSSKWLSQMWYRLICSAEMWYFHDTNLSPPVWVMLGLGNCGFFQSNPNSGNFRILFFFFPSGTALFPTFSASCCEKELWRNKTNKQKKKESTQLTSSCNPWILRYYVEVLITWRMLLK